MSKEEAKKEALALVVQERIERVHKIYEHSVDDEIKKINDLICLGKDICSEHFGKCTGCPLYKHICNGFGCWQREPFLWKLLD